MVTERDLPDQFTLTCRKVGLGSGICRYPNASSAGFKMKDVESCCIFQNMCVVRFTCDCFYHQKNIPCIVVQFNNITGTNVYRCSRRFGVKKIACANAVKPRRDMREARHYW